MVGVPNRIRTYVAAGNRRSPGPLDDRDAKKSEEPSRRAVATSPSSRPILHEALAKSVRRDFSINCADDIFQRLA